MYETDYSFVRSELCDFIYNNDTLSLTQKQKTMNCLLIGLYKTQILHYIDTSSSLEQVKQTFFNEIILNNKG